MKTIILYATKHEATREIAGRIASRLGDAALCDLGKDTVPPLSQFDCIVVGSPLYAGMIRKEAKTFVAQNIAVLSEKKVGLFLSGFEAENEQAYFENNFSPEILRIAKAKCFPGGIYDPSKAGILDKLMLKVVGKQMGYTNTINDTLIEQFAEGLNA